MRIDSNSGNRPAFCANLKNPTGAKLSLLLCGYFLQLLLLLTGFVLSTAQRSRACSTILALMVPCCILWVISSTQLAAAGSEGGGGEVSRSGQRSGGERRCLCPTTTFKWPFCVSKCSEDKAVLCLWLFWTYTSVYRHTPWRHDSIRFCFCGLRFATSP